VAGGATGSRSTAQPKAKRYTVPDGTDGSAEERAEEQSHQMQPSKPIFRDIIDSLDDCFRLFDRKVETFRNPPNPCPNLPRGNWFPRLIPRSFRS